MINWKLLFILALVVVAYGNNISHGLVWDDRSFIVEWQGRRDLAKNFGEFWQGQTAPRQEGVYRPIRSILYSLGYVVFGENPSGYHGAAVAMHLAAVVLVYAIGKELAGEKVGLTGAGIFGLHPINVEAVAWISASFDSVGVVMALGSIYGYMKPEKKWRALSVVLAMLAYFTNEITLVLPVLLVMIDWYRQTLKNWRQEAGRVGVISLGAAVYLLIRMGVLGIVGRGGYMYGQLGVSALVGVRAAAEFARSFLVPVKLGPIHVLAPQITSFFYHDFNINKPFAAPSLQEPVMAGAVAVLIAGCVLVWRAREKNKTVALAWAWFVVALLPVIQLVPLSILFAERYIYLASVGGAIGAAWVIVKVVLPKLVKKNETKGWLVTWGLLLVMTVATWQQNKIWASEETLWRRAMEIYSESSLVFTNLGKYYFENGNREAGLVYLKRAVELNDNGILPLTNLGVAYWQTGESDKAVAYLEEALALEPDYEVGRHSLVLIYMDGGKEARARELLGKMLETNPRDVWAMIQMAKSYHKEFIYNQAENFYDRALQIQPDNLDALNNLGNLYVEWGKLEEAKAMFERVAKIDEDYGDVKEKLEELSS